jgi:hypothetical protein
MTETTSREAGNVPPTSGRGSDAPIEGRCAAKLAGSNPPRYCRRWPITGRKRCRRHGGATPRGTLSPHYKHGGYVGALHTRDLRERFERAMQDPKWLTLRREDALTVVRIEALLERLGRGELALADRWRAVEAAHAEYRRAVTKRDPARMETAIAKWSAAVVGEGHEPGTADDVITSGLLTELVDQRRKLAESQAKIGKDVGQFVAVERFLSILDCLSLAVRRELVEAPLVGDLANRIATSTTKALDAPAVPPALAPAIEREIRGWLFVAVRAIQDAMIGLIRRPVGALEADAGPSGEGQP